MKIARTLLLVWAVIASWPLRAQWTTPRFSRVRVEQAGTRAPLTVFERITWEQGIPRGSVRGVFRDRKGFLWLSIMGYGPVRYDGRESRLFKHVPGDDTTFPAHNSWCVAEDSKGYLWFSTERGLARFDPTTERFMQVGESTYSSDVVVDGADRVWLVCPQKTVRYDPACSAFEEVTITEAINAFTGQTHRFAEKMIPAGFFSRQGNIWGSVSLAAGPQLLCCYRTDQNAWYFYPVPAGQRIPIGTLKYVNEAASKVLCMNWQSHIWQLDIPKREWTQFDLSALGVDSTYTSAGFDEATGKIWFSTSSQKTGWLDPFARKGSVYANQPGQPTAPLGLDIMVGLHRDAEGRFWWPANGGVYALDPRRQWLHHNLPERLLAKSYTDDYDVTYYDTLTQCFLGSMELLEPRRRIVRMGKQGQIRSVDIANPGVLRLMIRHGDHILLGHQGISYLDPQTMRVTHPNFPIANHPMWTTDSLHIQRRAARLPNGDLYLPTHTTQVLHYSQAKRAFYLVPTDNKALHFDNKYELGLLAADSKGNVWGAGSHGLVKISPQGERAGAPTFSLEHFLLYPKDSLPDVNNFCNWIAVSKGDTVWTSTTNGLFYFPPRGTRIYPVPNIDFPITRFFLDNKGEVWFKYNDGIGRYQSTTRRFETFDERDGLAGERYDRLFLADNGTLFFRGAYRWRPEDLPQNDQAPALVFTHFKVFERDFPLDSSVDYIHEIRLQAAQNFFSIGFAALQMHRPDQLAYAYQLVGVDTGWVQCGNRNFAQYTDVPPGHYVFRVQATGRGDAWMTEPRLLRIYIVPEWYQTGWFKIVVSLLASAMAWFLVRARIRQVTLQAHLAREKAEREKAESALREKEAVFRRQLAETEMAALRAQMNPHFIFNCLNSIKLYTEENDAETASFYLTKFSRLIRRVLENSRSEKVSLENELDALALYIQMEAMRFKEKVQYTLEIAEDVDVQFIEIPPLLLQPFVENAIWHGLMHKPEGGKVTIEVSLPEESTLRVRIEDNGIGRKQAALLKSKSAVKHKSLGMQVTHERIQSISHLYNIQTQVTIEDLMDTDGRPSGTRVTLDIPLV